MRKAAGWDYSLDSDDSNLVFHEQVLVVASPFPLLSHIPLWSLWGETRVKAPWALFFHWRYHRLRGELLAWCCAGLGGAKHSEYSHSSYLFNAICLGLVVQGCASATLPYSRILSGVLFMNSCYLFFWGGAKSGTTYVAILVMLFFLFVGFKWLNLKWF